MPKYRKKPVVVEAFEWRGGDVTDASITYPGWFYRAWGEGVVGAKRSGNLYIDTLEGRLIAVLGDYIIQGIEGELYPCERDIFHETYELVGEKTNANN